LYSHAVSPDRGQDVASGASSNRFATASTVFLEIATRSATTTRSGLGLPFSSHSNGAVEVRHRRRSAMYARVVSVDVRPERMDDCIRIFQEVNGPSIARQPGFEHGHWWVDRDSGEAVSVTFWDTAEHERSSRTNIPALIAGMAEVLCSHEVSQRSYERVHDQYSISS
jgi:hypothetical protein